MRREIGPAIYRASRETGINPQLIAAVIWQESRANPFAIRYEPKFFDRYIKGKELTGFVPSFKLISEETERASRAMSFGLMQVMGATARENGFEGTYLSELCDIQANIEIGVKILAKHIRKFEDTNKALLAYNGGGNKDYPLEVMEHIQSGDYQNVILL